MNSLDFWYKFDRTRLEHMKGNLTSEEENANIDDLLADMENLATLWRTRKKNGGE